jgi:hypothetical protein
MSFTTIQSAKLANKCESIMAMSRHDDFFEAGWMRARIIYSKLKYKDRKL